MKKLLSAVLAAAMLTSTLPTALAVSDIENHWAKPYLLEMEDLGVIKPSGTTGAYTPNQAIERWEFMRYVNRAFGFTETTNISFSDVPSNSLYYETVQTAVKYGYINGVGNNKMDPEGTLTREQAATILGRLHKYTPSASLSTLNSFTDRNTISDYAQAYVAEAVNLGYINGYTDGAFQPKGSLKRGEIAKILYYFLGTSLNTAGKSYMDSDMNSDTDNVTISEACTLSDVTVDGHLFITEGVGTGSVTLRNVNVKGNIIVSGGNVTLDSVTALHLYVSNPIDMTPQVMCTGGTNIGTTTVQTSAALTESGLSASAGGFADVELTGDEMSLTLDAAVWDLSTVGESYILTTGSTSIGELTANGATTVAGGGSVQSALINVDGCELVMQPASYELAKGITAVIAGRTVAPTTTVSVSPSALSVDINDKDAIARYTDFTFNADPEDLVRLSVDGTVLSQGTDYDLLTSKSGIRLYKDYLVNLKAGTYTAELLFRDNSKATFQLLVGNSAVGTVSPTQAYFDKYNGSANYGDVLLHVTMPTNTWLDQVKLGSTLLESGTDYDYDTRTGEFTLRRRTINQRATGTYTLTFIPSKGASFTCKITVSDSTPVNAVAPDSVDFDSNTSSGGHADIVVTLNTVDDAELQYIRAKGEQLEEGWQYKVSDNTVTISKAAVADINRNNDSYVDFTFVMSTGEDPVLRVNYVTTYALSASVVDDLGAPIQGATVTFAPTSSSAGSTVQTATTETDGTATVYVKRGSYTVTATHSRFVTPVSATVNVNSSQTVKLTGEILETVQIVVTNAYGAPLSGAVVTIGGKSVNTGADGTASFSLRRGTYTAQVACSGYSTQSLSLSVTDSVRERVQMN